MYILYIIFQLKSHAYLYASIPQQIIDEESHPGVLAEFMNSSDSSSSSSDESADTTTSWSTAKRIKRAMKYRRRRKSSTSSKDTNHPQSLRNGSLVEMRSDRMGSAVDSMSSHTDERASQPFNGLDGYEADNDGVRFNAPQSRDFGQEIGRSKSAKRASKSKKRHSKEMKKKMAEDPEKQAAAVDSIATAKRPELKSFMSSPIARFESNPVNATVGDANDLPKRRSPFRPPFPSLLSNTVFSSSAGPNGIPQAGSGNVTGLRRTNSLPSHMNRQPPVGNAVQFARGAARMPTAVNPVTTETAPPEHEPEMSRTAAVVMLLVSTALVAVCAEFLVDAIPVMVESSDVSEAFIGLIILPIVGNAAEHVTAVSVATKNKMDLSIGVSVGSSIQIGEESVR